MCRWQGGGGANFYSGACVYVCVYVCVHVCVYVNEYESRAQPAQRGCSFRKTCCLCAPVPSNGFRLVFTKASTELATFSDPVHCIRMSLGGSKLVQPQRFSVVSSNAIAIIVHAAQAVLRPIKVLRCSQPKKRKSLGVILRNASFTILIKPAERVLPVSAALP